MVNFEAQLSLEKKEIARNTSYGTIQVTGHPLEWEEGFIDYGGLKKSLKSLKSNVNEQSKADSFVAKRFQSSESLISLKKGKWDEQEDEFAKQLDAEVEKVFLFYLARQGELSSRILSIHMKARTLCMEGLNVSHYDVEDHLNSSIILGLREKLYDCERNMVHLLQFLRLNVTGLRKILKKHDKQIRDKLLARHYLTTRAKDKYSSINQKCCENLTLVTSTNYYYPWNYYQLIFSEGLLILIDSLKLASQKISRLEQSMANHLYNAQDKTFDGTVEMDGSQLQKSMSLGLDSQEIFAKICEEMALLRESRNRTIADYVFLPVGELLLEPGMDIEDMTAAEAHTVLVKLKLDIVSAYINLAYTFVYMNNYYIVAPSATRLAEVVSVNKSVSGVIIGMTAIASCISMILYSWWSNKCFKAPLLLCSVLLIMGNLLCIMAVEHRSFVMLLMGRSFVGLGAARVINRRYIADTVPFHKRTFFSAAFVAAGSLGMATGPALAGALENIHFDLGPFGIVDELKAPSWIMLFAWVGLGFLTVAYFKEPEERFTPHGKMSMPRYIGISTNKGVSPENVSGVISLGGSNGGKEDMEQPLYPVPESMTSWGLDEGKNSFQDVLPLIFCLSAYAVNKFVAEAIVCSTSIVTQKFFDWKLGNVGAFMAVLGLSALPLTVIIGGLSKVIQDSVLLCASAIFSAIFCVALLKAGDTYGELKYIIGTIGIYICVQCHEAVTMSITSKVIPHNLARGTFNSGFLATETGTAGRFVGDMLITMSGLVSVDSLPNAIYLPCFVILTLLSITSVLVKPYFDL